MYTYYVQYGDDFDTTAYVDETETIFFRALHCHGALVEKKQLLRLQSIISVGFE